jgi:hypothetical protein
MNKELLIEEELTTWTIHPTKSRITDLSHHGQAGELRVNCVPNEM